MFPFIAADRQRFISVILTKDAVIVNTKFNIFDKVKISSYSTSTLKVRHRRLSAASRSAKTASESSGGAVGTPLALRLGGTRRRRFSVKHHPQPPSFLFQSRSPRLYMSKRMRCPFRLLRLKSSRTAYLRFELVSPV